MSAGAVLRRSLARCGRSLLVVLVTAITGLALRGTRAEAQELPEIPPGYKIVEGDILVPDIDPDFIGPLAAAAAGQEKWPDGIVWFEFDSNVTPTRQANVYAAIALWEAATNVDFREMIAESPDYYLHIQSGSANSSPVGRQDLANQPQVVNIVSWTSPGVVHIIAHELGHALGFWHEQSRSTVTYDPRCADPQNCDRNDFVTPNFGNIASTCGNGSQSCAFNFQAENDFGYGPYDYDSVMHYWLGAFSTNATNPALAPTLTVNQSLVDQPIPFVRPQNPADPNDGCFSNAPDANADWDDVPSPSNLGLPGPPAAAPLGIGQRTHLSYWDCKIMSFWYPEDEWRFVSVDNPFPGPGPGDFENPHTELGSALAETVGSTVTKIFILAPGVYEVPSLTADAVLDSSTYPDGLTIEAPVGGVQLVPGSL